MKKYQNAKINDNLKYYSEKCLKYMKKGMTLSISIENNEMITIVYYKN